MKTRFETIEAVTFDFYNTLAYHRTGSGRGAMLMEYLRAQGLESDPWEHQVLYDVFERHAKEYAPELSDRDKYQYHRRLANRLFRRLNVRGPDSAAERHASGVWTVLGPASLAVFADVAEVLRRLNAAGYPLAVVSNWQCGLAHFCSDLGLRDAFAHVLASAEVGCAKPDPGIFHEATSLLGVPADRVLHIGDSIVDDLKGARGAGLHGVLLRRDDAELDREASAIASLETLPALLGLR